MTDWDSMYRGQRVLVTGADSFLGRWVARALTAAGAELWLVAGDAAALEASRARYAFAGAMREADLAREGEFARVYGEARPAITFNLAQYGLEPGAYDEARAEAINARLPQEIVRTIAEDAPGDWPGLRLVHAGSAAEYGEMNITVNEDSPAQPASVYGRTKLAGADHILTACERGLRAAVARLSTVYGPGEHAERLLPSLLRAARSGESLPLAAGEHTRDFLYVEDAAEGLMRLGMQSQPIGLMNLATGRLTAVREFAESAAEQLTMRAGQLQFSARPPRDDEAAHGPVDITRLKKNLFWKPVIGVREGIRRAIAFGA